MFDPPVGALMLGGSAIGAMCDVTGNTKSTNWRTPLLPRLSAKAIAACEPGNVLV